MPSPYQQETLQALLELFLEATGQSLPAHSKVKSASTSWREYPYHLSSLQSLPLVSPFERFSHRVIEISNEI